MLQTTENQLTLKQIRLKHRQLIINELTNAGYADIIENDDINHLPQIIYSKNSPIDYYLALYAVQNSYEYLNISDCDMTCERFSTNDIMAVSNLYIHMLKNNMKHTPDVIKNLNATRVEPGQLAKIISEYLTKEKN